MIPSSEMAPVAWRATDSASCSASALSTIFRSASSSKGIPARAAWPRRTIDITPAICFGPITAIFDDGQMKVNRLPKARPDMPYVPAPNDDPMITVRCGTVEFDTAFTSWEPFFTMPACS